MLFSKFPMSYFFYFSFILWVSPKSIIAPLYSVSLLSFPYVQSSCPLRMVFLYYNSFHTIFVEIFFSQFFLTLYFSYYLLSFGISLFSYILVIFELSPIFTLYPFYLLVPFTILNSMFWLLFFYFFNFFFKKNIFFIF